MRILLAAPDRDLLECYKKLFEADLGETVTAFDGTQTVSLLAAEDFDVMILDRGIPRVDYRQILRRASGRKVPAVVLTEETVGVRQLTADPLPNGWLTYPFTVGRAEDAVRDVIEKSSSAELLDIGGAVVAVSEFRIKGGPRLTSGEINVLKALADGRPVAADEGACISALNSKLAGTGTGVRIKYGAKKGFELVMKDE